jgi:hypothetical protein
VGHCYCGPAETRPYACGPRCRAHTPAALAGRPEPGTRRYCAPARCYCGSCPSWTPDASYFPGDTVVDIEAVRSGKRRSSLTQYRNAQANSR